MIIKVLTKKEASSRSKEQTNNPCFVKSVIDEITRYKLASLKVWHGLEQEIANAQEVLDIYKLVFGIKTNAALFKHIKNQPNIADDIWYDWLQAWLVDIYYGIRGEGHFGTLRLRYFKHNLTYNITRRVLRNKLLKKYDKSVSVRNLKNKHNIIVATERHNGIVELARKNGQQSNKRYEADFLNDIKTNPDTYKIVKWGDRTRIYAHMKKHLGIKDKRTQKKLVDKYIIKK